MTPFHEGAVFLPGPNVHARALGDELVLLDFARGEYFALNAIGALVWQEIERGASIREMASLVASRYDVSERDALRDISNLVRELCRRSLASVR